MMILEIVFWSVLALLAYTLVGFPLLVRVRAAFFPAPVQAASTTPKVSLIVSAHNEEQSIGDKLQNLMMLDYPRELLQVIVASDGSSDRTCDIVRQYESRGILLLDLPRMGKAKALNAAVEQAEGEVLIFSDANSMFAADAIQQLVRPFADEKVGGVAGDQRYQKQQDTGEQGERAYWNFDRLLKRWESRAGHVISATGAIYAIRRRLFIPVPDGVTDDFVTSTRIIQQGYRLVFQENACAYEPAASSRGVEFGRKVRIMTRGLRGVMTVRNLLNPFRFGFYSLQLFSHKVLRRLIAIPLILLFVLSGILSFDSNGFLAFFLMQSTFYLAAVAGLVFHRRFRGPWKLLVLPSYFCMVNVAALIALLNTLRGHRIDRWEPKRTVDAGGLESA